MFRMVEDYLIPRTVRPRIQSGAMRCADGNLCAGCGFVFPRAADVQEGESDLHHDDRVGPVMPAPDHPQHIAAEETPETEQAFASGLRRGQPGRNNGGDHRRPLQQVQFVHVAGPVLFELPVFALGFCHRFRFQLFGVAVEADENAPRGQQHADCGKQAGGVGQLRRIFM